MLKWAYGFGWLESMTAKAWLQEHMRAHVLIYKQEIEEHIEDGQGVLKPPTPPPTRLYPTVLSKQFHQTVETYEPTGTTVLQTV